MVEQQAEVSLLLEQTTGHVALAAAGHLHLQTGKALRQRFQAVQHRLVRHRLVLGQAQPRLLAARQAQRAPLQALALAQHLARLRQQHPALVGQARLASAAAFEQGDAEVRLQQRDAVAHRRLHPLQFAGGGRERLALGDADEQADLLQVPLHNLSPIQIGNDFIPSAGSLEWPQFPEDPAMTNYLYLAIAIAAEVVATTSLKAVAGFSKPLPLLLVVGGYVLAFSMLVLVMRTLPVGVVYAIWSGLGIVLVSLVAMFVYGQRLDPAALLGIGLIIAGVLVIQLFSRASGH